MRTSKCHPVVNWLRCDAGIYSRTLDQILRHRDEQMAIDPNCSGLPPASREWFWSTQLPALVADPKIREQVHARAAELSARRQAIDEELRHMAAHLVDEQHELAAEQDLIEQVLA